MHKETLIDSHGRSGFEWYRYIIAVLSHESPHKMELCYTSSGTMYCTCCLVQLWLLISRSSSPALYMRFQVYNIFFLLFIMQVRKTFFWLLHFTCHNSPGVARSVGRGSFVKVCQVREQYVGLDGPTLTRSQHIA